MIGYWAFYYSHSPDERKLSSLNFFITSTEKICYWMLNTKVLFHLTWILSKPEGMNYYPAHDLCFFWVLFFSKSFRRELHMAHCNLLWLIIIVIIIIIIINIIVIIIITEYIIVFWRWSCNHIFSISLTVL